MSTLHLELFERPRFREGVQLIFDEGGVECVYRDQGCRVDFADAAEAAEAGDAGGRRLIELLREGEHTREELERECPALDGGVPEVLTALDALGLLTEAHLPPPEGVVSGRQLYRELRRVADRHHDRVITERFYRAMADGLVTRDQLIGYVLEYYHLVRMAPRLLAPALSKEDQGRTTELLQDFLVSELHHDRMLEKSLGAVGIAPDQLRMMQPLPMTYGLCVSIGAYAAQNPLTFKALLYLFEETAPEFNDAFAEACRAVDLPEDFIRPILAHAQLNDDGSHGDISADLLAEVPVVGPEEQHTVRKHLAIVVETFALQEHEILDYYGAPDAVIPRVFD